MEKNTNTEQPAADVGALLNAARQSPVGATLVDYNPMDKIPTLSIGEEITPGTVLNGSCDGTDIIASVKFIHSKERNESGVPVQRLHRLRLLDGTVVGLWSTGELRAVWDKLAMGEFISIKYIEKGVNAKGQQQHFFEFKKSAN